MREIPGKSGRVGNSASRVIFKECGCTGDHKRIQLTEPQVLLAIVGVYSILLTLCYRNGSTKDVSVV